MLVALQFALADEPYIPPDGFVPDGQTAMRIAEAVWIPIYGERKIQEEKPYVATLKDGIWIVTGSLPKLPNGGAWVGGVAEIQISKQDGRILKVSHGE